MVDFRPILIIRVTEVGGPWIHTFKTKESKKNHEPESMELEENPNKSVNVHQEIIWPTVNIVKIE